MKKLQRQAAVEARSLGDSGSGSGGAKLVSNPSQGSLYRTRSHSSRSRGQAVICFAPSGKSFPEHVRLPQRRFSSVQHVYARLRARLAPPKRPRRLSPALAPKRGARLSLCASSRESVCSAAPNFSRCNDQLINLPNKCYGMELLLVMHLQNAATCHIFF
jgi:hypothetical protein